MERKETIKGLDDLIKLLEAKSNSSVIKATNSKIGKFQMTNSELHGFQNIMNIDNGAVGEVSLDNNFMTSQYYGDLIPLLKELRTIADTDNNKPRGRQIIDWATSTFKFSAPHLSIFASLTSLLS